MNVYPQVVFRLLDPTVPDRQAQWVCHGLRGVLCVGLASTMLRTSSLAAGYTGALDALTLTVMVVMAVDYALRVFAAPGGPNAMPGHLLASRLRYAGSLVGVVDLAAFAPMAAAAAAGASPNTVGLLAMLWLLKLVRYSPNLELLGRVFRNARKPLMSVMLLFASVLFLAATVAHVLEGERQPGAFGSVGNSLWWAIATLTTTGYGDEVPISTAGRVLAGVVMVSGIAVFGLWAGILATGFSQELRRQDFLKTWELVARVPFFQDIGAAAIAEVAGLLRPQTFSRGANIFWKGQRGECMYFVVSGRVEIGVDDRKVDYGPGEFFGEVALVSQQPRTGHAVAAEACQLLLLDIADFHELAKRLPEVSQAIHSTAAQRLGRSESGRESHD